MTNTNKPETENPQMDKMPTNAELDALQAQIEDAAKAVGARNNESDSKSDGNGENEQTPEPELTEAQITAARIEELEAELASTKDQALRAMAETQNIKKRSEREVRAASIYAVERFAVDMVSVSDNLARALSTIDDNAKGDLGENAKHLLDGLELTEKDLIAVFSRHGIKPVPGKGSKFDPNIHQAVAQIPSDEIKGDVAQVMQNGFTLGDRTLRAAMVAVSTGPQKAG
ncbi:MAG: nucleotide exchange factor GrpE [Robiginitomaculum sp.]|nr:MAG: nucleotide exchange factor GrpE [Robiginitomaculum sp.]